MLAYVIPDTDWRLTWRERLLLYDRLDSPFHPAGIAPFIRWLMLLLEVIRLNWFRSVHMTGGRCQRHSPILHNEAIRSLEIILFFPNLFLVLFVFVSRISYRFIAVEWMYAPYQGQRLTE